MKIVGALLHATAAITISRGFQNSLVSCEGGIPSTAVQSELNAIGQSVFILKINSATEELELRENMLGTFRNLFSGDVSTRQPRDNRLLCQISRLVVKVTLTATPLVIIESNGHNPIANQIVIGL